MSTTASGTINVSVQATTTKTGTPLLGSVVDAISKSVNDVFANGTGAAKLKAVYGRTLSIAYNSTQVLDLNAITDSWGAALNLTLVRALYVRHTGSSVNSCIIGNEAATALPIHGDKAHTNLIRPGGTFLIDVGMTDATGYSTTSGNLLKFTSGAEDVTGPLVVDVIIFGETA